MVFPRVLGTRFYFLAIFPCILFCYILYQWLFQNALAAFRDVMGSYCFLCIILLYHRQKQKFSLPFRLLQYLLCHCFVLYFPQTCFHKNVSANIMYRIIDNGHPCCSSLLTRKTCDKCLFTFICVSMF